jgi:hypothetical protein
VFEIVRDEDGIQHAIGPLFSVTVLPDKARDARIYWRNSQKIPGPRKRVLCAKVDGVRLYVEGNKLVMTKKRLMGEKK